MKKLKNATYRELSVNAAFDMAVRVLLFFTSQIANTNPAIIRSAYNAKMI